MKLLSIQQVADIIGVSRMTIDRMIKRGQLKPIYLSKRLIRFKESDLKELISTSATLPDHQTPPVDLETGEYKK